MKINFHITSLPDDFILINIPDDIKTLDQIQNLAVEYISSILQRNYEKGNAGFLDEYQKDNGGSIEDYIKRINRWVIKFNKTVSPAAIKVDVDVEFYDSYRETFNKKI